jgi:hypothetical protein
VLTELRRGQIPPEPFSALRASFGELPEEGQKELALRIIKASNIYLLRKSVEKHQFPRAQQHQKHLKSIRTSSKHLLALLGIRDPSSVARGIYPPVEIRINKATTPPTVTIHPAELPPTVTIHPTATLLLTSLYRVAVDRRPATASVSADERLTTLILLLSDLAEAAEQCALEISTRYTPGRGGVRRAGPTAEGELLQALIASYAALRKRFPSSGPQPDFDRPLRQFVRSSLKLVALAGANIPAVDPRLAKPTFTRAAIRAAFNRWRANQ